MYCVKRNMKHNILMTGYNSRLSIDDVAWHMPQNYYLTLDLMLHIVQHLDPIGPDLQFDPFEVDLDLIYGCLASKKKVVDSKKWNATLHHSLQHNSLEGCVALNFSDLFASSSLLHCTWIPLWANLLTERVFDISIENIDYSWEPPPCRAFHARNFLNGNFLIENFLIEKSSRRNFPFPLKKDPSISLWSNHFLTTPFLDAF